MICFINWLGLSNIIYLIVYVWVCGETFVNCGIHRSTDTWSLRTVCPGRMRRPQLQKPMAYINYLILSHIIYVIIHKIIDRNNKIKFYLSEALSKSRPRYVRILSDEAVRKIFRGGCRHRVVSDGVNNE